MRKTAQIMGTAVSIDAPNLKDASIIEAAFKRLREIDRKFSPYKKNSELSKYNRGELNEQTLSAEMKFILHACRRAEERTNGYFSAWYGGAVDPNGYVKGWAIAEAGKVLEETGYKTYCIYAGGDILAHSDGSKNWNIAIQDPRNKHKILNPSTSLGASKAVIKIKNGAVATSGNYERGKHIINPMTKKPADELLSFTVVGPDIVMADILATAAFAMGQKGIDFIKKQKGYEAIVIK
jgi:thiamine biosynthesis lipoprotein